MCKFKSGIITKDEVYIFDYDSHTNMLEELNIKDIEENARRLFVRAELFPIDGDVFSDIDTWEFNVDQDILPEWFVEEIDRERMRTAVKKWAKTHILNNINGLRISSGSGYYIKDCKNVDIYGSAMVEYIGGSTQVWRISGSATVNNICDFATVEHIYNCVTVKNIHGSAMIKQIYDWATIWNIRGLATVACIFNSVKVNYIYGFATVGSIYDSVTVDNIGGSAIVENIGGSAIVENINGSATVKHIRGFATVVGNIDSMPVSGNAIYINREAKKIFVARDFEIVKTFEGH